jgi:hypothetical protein
LILFLFGFIFYHIVNIHNQTAPYKYANYDVEIKNISPNQAHKIQNYEYVDKFITYTEISPMPLKSKDSAMSTSFIIIRSNNLRDADYTPFSSKLILQRDDSILNDNSTNSMLLCISDAKKMNVKIGDKITTELSDMPIEYTIAGIYEDTAKASSLPPGVFVLLNDTIAKWIMDIERKSDSNIKEEDIACNHGFIKFKDKDKGHEMINNLYSDIVLFQRYGEDWLNKATPAELSYSKGDYAYRDRNYRIQLNNMADGYIKVVGLIVFGFLTLIIFIVWQQNKLISLTMQSISIFVASGCRKVGFFLYYFATTFFKQLIYLIISIPIIKYLLMSYLSNEYFQYHLPWYLLIENLPIILSAILISSLTVSFVLYIKLKRKMVLFTGEE